MARSTIIKNTMILSLSKPLSMQGLVSVKERLMSKLARLSPPKSTENDKECDNEIRLRDDPSANIWVPHQRTGIYFPIGRQDSVMDDIPLGAASFDPTFWLRNTDGLNEDKRDFTDDFSTQCDRNRL